MRDHRDFRMANKGQTLEQFIRFANEQYRKTGEAVVTKIPTEFLPIRNAYGQVVNCKVAGKASVDFIGRVRTYPLAAEAKETKEDMIRFDRVEDHQADFLDAFTEHQQGIGIVVVAFNMERFYAVPWQCWREGRDAWKAAQRARKRKAEQRTINYHGQEWTTPGRAGVKECELLPEWKIEVGGRYGLDYLRHYIKRGTMT